MLTQEVHCIDCKELLGYCEAGNYFPIIQCPMCRDAEGEDEDVGNTV